MTADLTRVLLYDSLKIMKNREDEIPHYTEKDVLSMLDRITPVRYQTPMRILTALPSLFILRAILPEPHVFISHQRRDLSFIPEIFHPYTYIYSRGSGSRSSDLTSRS